jgi:hypothetical protein
LIVIPQEVIRPITGRLADLLDDGRALRGF